MMIIIIVSQSSLDVGHVNSHRRTQMNLRGWSCWMLPSPPVSRLGYSRVAAVRSQLLVPAGASMSLASQCAFTPLTAGAPVTSPTPCLVSPGVRTVFNPPIRSGSAPRRAPWRGAPAAACTAQEPRNKNSLARLRGRAAWIRGLRRVSLTVDAWVWRSVPWRHQLWFPCATWRVVINTLHCSVDAPS